MQIATPKPANFVAPRAPAAQADQPAQALVMMVDDEPINIDIAQTFLEEAGYRRFCSTSDATEVLAKLRAQRPDLLLLDLLMPCVGGFEILTAMRADPQLRHVPVIVLTCADDPQTRRTALELGAAELLVKPVLASTLLSHVHDCLRQRAARPGVGRLGEPGAAVAADARALPADALPAALPAGPAAFAAEQALVMMVDDEPINIDMTQAFLEEAGYRRFCSTTDSTRAIEMLRMERPHVLLLDIQMPQVDGFQILTAMRADPVLCHIPVIVLTSAIDAQTKLGALELGAADFLGKPVDASELVLRLRNTLSARAYQDYLAHFDRLTGLPNRQRCLDEIERAIRRADARGGIGAVIQIDVDRFKTINEALGPAVGDELLKQVADRVAGCMLGWHVRNRGPEFTDAPLLSRFDGDEFTVLLPEVDALENAADFAVSLRKAGTLPYLLAGREVFVTLSGGIAMFPDDGDNVDSLIMHAGAAMHHAKQAGRDNCRFYAAEQNARALLHLSLEAELRHAIERGELCMYYQPKIDIATRRLTGAEALVRWNHPAKGFLPPAHFIPMAEATGLIVPLGEWVMKDVCRQVAAWQAAGLPDISVSINVAPQQFRQPHFIASVRRLLESAGVARHLCFELTETTMMDHPETKLEGLHELKQMGLRLSIDDFGVGYSSLSYLRRFPLDELKIDKSFIDEVESSEDSAAIVVAIIAMARSLGLAVVAEGVETRGQLEFLAARNCGECQGYLFSKPVSAQEFERTWLHSGRRADGAPAVSFAHA